MAGFPYPTLDDVDVKDKTVLLRVDINAALDPDTKEILDDTRIRAIIPTLKELLEKNAKVVILAHQGRPGRPDFTDLSQHAKLLSKLMGKEIRFVDDIVGEKAKNAIKSLKPGEAIMLDNVRKLSDEREKKDFNGHAKSTIVRELAPLADIFVNDAFAAIHRSHASIVGFIPVLPTYLGRLMERELKALSRLVESPERPTLYLFGGAKFEDGAKLIETLLDSGKADKVVATGLFGQAFHRALGADLGKPNNEFLDKHKDSYPAFKKVYEKFKDRILLPVDFAADVNGKRKEFSFSELPVEYPIYDIGHETIELIKKEIAKAKTIFVSGPPGVFEREEFMIGTKEVFTAVAEADAYTVIGGGHSAAAMHKFKLADKVSYISTGGGALEAFITGKKLPVLEALKATRQIKK